MVYQYFARVLIVNYHIMQPPTYAQFDGFLMFFILDLEQHKQFALDA
jgi:hypothetical protein